MPTLLDTAEFARVNGALELAKELAETARQDRLESVRKHLEMSETDLARVKQQALELPAAIARYRAEIARLEATTGGDILREAMSAHEVVLHAQPPGEVVEVQSPKPHACPRCDEAMRRIEFTRDIEWPGWGALPKGWRTTASEIKPGEAVLDGQRSAMLSAYRFVSMDVPPPSEWCDGNGKGGAE